MRYAISGWTGNPIAFKPATFYLEVVSGVDNFAALPDTISRIIWQSKGSNIRHKSIALVGRKHRKYAMNSFLIQGLGSCLREEYYSRQKVSMRLQGRAKLDEQEVEIPMTALGNIKVS